jgi:hypothetical protein
VISKAEKAEAGELTNPANALCPASSVHCFQERARIVSLGHLWR